MRRALACNGLVAVALLLFSVSAHAITATPLPIESHQPDGTTFLLRLRGDEYYHWFEDMNGYAVVQVGDEYRYATHDAAGELVATPYPVGKFSPSTTVGIEFRHRPGPDARLRLQQVRAQQMKTAAAITPPNGTVKNLVVLAQFFDHGGLQTRPASEYTTLFNTAGGDPTIAPSGSVRDVWKENSYNDLDLVSTVHDWVVLPQYEAYYANGKSGLAGGRSDQMVTDALNAIDSAVNFADFDANNDGYVDAIDVIHSGYGAEAGGSKTSNQIWSHQWALTSDWVSADKNANGVNVRVSSVHTEPALWGTSGTAISRIGVIAHETGHFFGLPDLYDYDSDGSGAGNWCLMANSWGWDQSQHFPPHLCAWSKSQLGYVLPTVLTSPGPQYVGQAETSPTAYRINLNYTGNEYLLIENRQPTGFDQQIPQGGIAIWHIDDNIAHFPGAGFNQNQGYPGQPGWPGNGLHYGVALLQADGNYDLEKAFGPQGDATDLWRVGYKSVINEGTVPNTDRYVTYANPTGNQITVTTISQPIMGIDFRPSLWVDFAYGGFYLGTFDQPYNTVAAAEAAAPTNWGIVCKSGTSGERPTLTKPLEYRTWNGTTTLGP